MNSNGNNKITLRIKRNPMFSRKNLIRIVKKNGISVWKLYHRTPNLGMRMKFWCLRVPTMLIW